MTTRSPIGLIAGGGSLPLEFVCSCQKKNVPVAAALIHGAAAPSLGRRIKTHQWISIGQLGGMISFFKKCGVRKTAMLGKVQHAETLRNPRLDWRAIRLLARLRDRSGESILRGIGDELKKEGIALLDSRQVLEGLVARPGDSVSYPKGRERVSIGWGLRKARSLAKEGIGQSLLVKRRVVVAVEGVEGTDAAIRRAGRWGGRGTVLIKVASPQQDWRFDVPTVGPRTIISLDRAGAAGLVVEAGKAFIVDKEKTMALARQRKIFIQVV